MNTWTKWLSLPVVVCLLCLGAGRADAADTSEAPPAAEAAEPEVSEAPPPVDVPDLDAPPEAPPDAAVAEPNVAEPTTSPGEGLRFNFNDVPLDKVLNYLSEAGGFIVIREAKVEGRVDVVSHQPLNKDEAVALLNTVLNEKGFAAVRNDRTLTIVKREEAGKRNIPVRAGSAPETIPKTDEMITQIIPVRYADATQLLENLKPLLPSYAVASANKSSNAIVLTDIQANVRRMAEIIRALDTSISAISEIRVFTLTYSKAADTAKLLNTLFQPPTAQGQQGNTGGNNPIRQFMARMRGGGGGDQPAQDSADSAAKQAAMRVQAVADERTNAVVVGAPGDLMPLIEEVIDQIDKASVPATEVRVFPLKYADAAEMAQVVNAAFAVKPASTAAGGQPTQRFFGMRGGGQNQQGAQQSAMNDSVNAVADPRTNSVVVTAEFTLMEQVARMVEQLDNNPARDQKVFVYKLKNADAAEVAGIMQGMFNDQGTAASRPRQNSSQPANRSQNRTSAGTTRGSGTGTGAGAQAAGR